MWLFSSRRLWLCTWNKALCSQIDDSKPVTHSPNDTTLSRTAKKLHYLSCLCKFLTLAISDLNFRLFEEITCHWVTENVAVTAKLNVFLWFISTFYWINLKLTNIGFLRSVILSTVILYSDILYLSFCQVIYSPVFLYQVILSIDISFRVILYTDIFFSFCLQSLHLSTSLQLSFW